MSRRPIATVAVMPLDHLAEGAVRVEISCPASTTGLTHVPGGAFEMETPALITIATFAHADRCDGGCDTSTAHAQGDQRVKAEAERLAEAVQQRAARRYAEGRRN